MPASTDPASPGHRPDQRPDPRLDPGRISTVLCDLDGVLWLQHEPIAGSVDAVASLRRSGRRVLFVTNNSAAPVARQEQALGAIGVAAAGDVVTSAMAAARLIRPGERVLVTGGPGITEAVEAGGGIAVPNVGVDPDAPVEVVMVGLHRDFDYARLAVAAAALHAGARLIGTNSDPTYPTPSGPQPGGGSILAAVAIAGECEPVIAGKPHAPMAALIAAVVSPDAAFDPASAVMVGDRPDTDGLMATRIGCPFALVRSGVTAPTAPRPTIAVALDVADLAAVARHLGAA